MKIALVHDHLTQDGGAERVLQALKELYPQAPIFTLIFDAPRTNQFFAGQPIRTSFLQKLPFGVRGHQWWLPVMPAAIEHLDLMDYDVVISSASSFAKGILTRPGAVHICYCHTPTRYLWLDTHNYLKELQVSDWIKNILPLTLKKLRQWDKMAADRVDYFIANSAEVKKRIKKYYQRDSTVIYPPVDIDRFYISQQPKEYYLAGGRLVPYKRLDIVIRAFSRLGVPLKVFGVGPEMKRLKLLAKENIEFIGRVSDADKPKLFADCIAYINPQDEDFGITAVEAMASGRPVIAYRAGGALETMVDGVTGTFFDEQWWEELADAVIRFRPEHYQAEKIRAHAYNFSTDKFKKNISELVTEINQTLNELQ